MKYKKTTLNKLFNTKNCYGWAWHTEGRKYAWHNDNDLGLLSFIDEATYPETVLRKIEVVKGKYLYILRNDWGIDGTCESEDTLPVILACLKECHSIELTEHEKMLIKRSQSF